MHAWSMVYTRNKCYETSSSLDSWIHFKLWHVSIQNCSWFLLSCVRRLKWSNKDDEISLEFIPCILYLVGCGNCQRDVNPIGPSQVKKNDLVDGGSTRCRHWRGVEHLYTNSTCGVIVVVRADKKPYAKPLSPSHYGVKFRCQHCRGVEHLLYPKFDRFLLYMGSYIVVS